MPKLTTAQKQLQLDQARDWLADWQTKCRERATLVKFYEEQYGDEGPLISGAHRDHYPIAVKAILRRRAHEITESLDKAVACWRASGKRMNTFRRVLDTYRNG